MTRQTGTRRTGARRRALTAGAIAVASVTAVATMPGMALGAESAVTPVVQDLVGPRGLWAEASGRAIFAEADGTVTLKTKGAATRRLTTVPATGIAPAVTRKAGKIFILTTGGEPGSGATLYRYGNRSGQTKPVADIAAYQAEDPDPYNLEGVPEESNPFGAAALKDGSVLVADAAGNDLLRVYPDGDIDTVARLKPRVVEAPPEFEGVPDLPPPGTPLPAEAVATSVTVGADGYYYVGELRGFPATPGSSEIWRIAPDSVGAVCDPEAPDTGNCQRYADGLTSIVDLASGKDGSVYALEVAKASWFQVEAGLAAPIGGLFRIAAPGSEPTELAADQLFAPGGIDVTSGSTLYVTTPLVPAGPGALVEVSE